MPDLERLRQLRRVAEAAPEDRLNMAQFCTRGEPCGTAYCLAGWAAIDPWFRGKTAIGEIFETSRDESGQWVVRARDLLAFDRLKTLFDLDTSDTDALFGGTLSIEGQPFTVSRAEVLANIDRLIAGQPAVRYPDNDD